MRTDQKPLILSGVSPRLITPSVRQIITETANHARKLKLVDHSDLSEVVGNLAGFELIYPELKDELAGWCSLEKKEIAIRQDAGLRAQIRILCHEMGHAIQLRVGHYDTRPRLLSGVINEEQQAETIGYYLMQSLFPSEKTSPGLHSSYFNQGDIDFLCGYYNGWIEDDLPEIILPE